MTFLLAGVERRVLQYLAARVPRALRSNHLTVLGTLGAAGAGTALTGMVVLFVGRFARNLYRLAKLEPQRFRWWEERP
jgi:hypothetical protein